LVIYPQVREPRRLGGNLGHMGLNNCGIRLGNRSRDTWLDPLRISWHDVDYFT
jgi:hypothetical protein